MSTATTAQTTGTSPDIDALKTRLKATWSDGNYDYFSRFMESSAVQFLDRLNVPAGAAVLDVACGSGQLALVAARRGAKATGVDIAANSIAAARGRAAAEGLDARFDEGDAEALPYPDASFDVVATIFGAMFAPRPELVTAELLRVTRPGGTIAMANWTKEGFIGQMFKIIAKFIAPPGMPSPVLWGDENTVRGRFGTGVSDLRLTRVLYRFDYPFSPADVVEFFRQNYGPMARAFAALGESEQAALRADLIALWSAHNLSTDPGRTLVDAEYLEVVGIHTGGRASMTTRSEQLAQRIEQGARQLAAYAQGLSDAQWKTVIPPDGRTAGVMVHHVANMYPIEIQLATVLASGKPIEGVTWAAVADINAKHAIEKANCTKEEALAFLRQNSQAAADAVRKFTDEELERAAPVSLNADAPLTTQFFIEDHALRHSWHHLAKLKAVLEK